MGRLETFNKKVIKIKKIPVFCLPQSLSHTRRGGAISGGAGAIGGGCAQRGSRQRRQRTAGRSRRRRMEGMPPNPRNSSTSSIRFFYLWSTAGSFRCSSPFCINRVRISLCEPDRSRGCGVPINFVFSLFPWLKHFCYVLKLYIAT